MKTTTESGRPFTDKDKWGSRPGNRYISNLVHIGKLTRQPCVFCGKPKGMAHHEDYNKPLEIVWVCALHHSAIHRGKLKVLRKHITAVQGNVRCKGSSHPAAKLTEQQVREILGNPHVPGTVYAKQFGVVKSLICMIRKRQKWKHLTA